MPEERGVWGAPAAEDELGVRGGAGLRRTGIRRCHRRQLRERGESALEWNLWEMEAVEPRAWGGGAMAGGGGATVVGDLKERRL